jgi:ABC-type uncharacterized transport system involved in gliding motility auxiliary subunit
VLGENGNPEHPVSSGFSGVDLFWASPIELNPPEQVTGEILFSSTPGAWLMTGNFVTNPDPQNRFDREAPDTQGVKTLAVALSGKFPSWFEGLPKPVREGSPEELPDRIGETRDSRIIVIGDTDFASFLMQYAQAQRNLDFLVQAADWLGNDDDIIGIRNQRSRIGRLDRILDQERRERLMAFSRFLNVVLIPLGVIMTGIFFAWRRKKTGTPRKDFDAL